MRFRPGNAIVNTLCGSALPPRHFRRLLLALYGAKIGTWQIQSRCYWGSRNIRIGRGSRINVGVYFDSAASITIGRECSVSAGVVFMTADHLIGGEERRAADRNDASIVVEDGAWIGARAMVMPGVTIGRGAVIGAGALVREDCEPNTLYVGVPARAIRSLPVSAVSRVAA